MGEEVHGQGIGRALVRHAATVTRRAAELIAVRALVVDALDQRTAAFYERVGFTPNTANALRLEILVKDIEATEDAPVG